MEKVKLSSFTIKSKWKPYVSASNISAYRSETRQHCGVNSYNCVFNEVMNLVQLVRNYNQLIFMHIGESFPYVTKTYWYC